MNEEVFQNQIQSLMESLGQERIESCLKFWREAFDATGNSRGDAQVVYPLLEANLDKLDDTLIKVLKVWLPFSFSYFSSDEYPVYAEVVNSLSNLIRQFSLGNQAFNLEIAITSREMILTVLAHDTFPKPWAATHSFLGNDYQDRIFGNPVENITSAINHCQKALQVYTRDAYPEEWASTQLCLADAYGKRLSDDVADNLKQKITCFHNALQIYTREGYPELWAGIQNNLGTVYRTEMLGDKAENLVKAIFYYQASLQIYTRDAFPENYASIYGHLGIAYKENQEFKNAYHALATAISTVESLPSKLTNISGNQAKQDFAEPWIFLYYQIIAVCLNLANDEPHYYAQAIEYIERNKARNLVELLATRDEERHKEIEAEQRQLDIANRELSLGNLLANLAAYVEKLEATGALDESIVKIRRENPARQQRQQEVIKDHLSKGSELFTQSNQRLNQLQQKQSNSKLKLTQTNDYISYCQIKDLLTNNRTIIIGWHLDMVDNCVVTFIITKESDSPIIFQSSSEDMDSLNKFYSEYLTVYSANKNLYQSDLKLRLEHLSKILHLNEIIALLPKDCTQVILIPDRFLHLFPIHALPVSSPNRQGEVAQAESPPEFITLLDLFAEGVCYSPSCHLLQLTQGKKNLEFNNCLAIQNPTQDLAYALVEVEAVCNGVTAAEVLVAEKATKVALNEALNNENTNPPASIHFACHGYFNLRSPLQSYLKMADGELTLADIFDLDLDQCRLATLSACETGLSDHISISNDYISLPSGFLYAGASNVVSSLWTVNDLSTAFLMIKFYQNLQVVQSVAVALNQAQLWLRDITKKELETWIEENQLPLKPAVKMGLRRRLYQLEDDAKPFQDPFHWAAFCAMGQ
ncbi:MAG: CHAT domain-containing protein [Symploca sp. SIO3E6]|nr:CHAT domain-containing protein [Caldora sp. SIO3E6]